MEFKIIPEYENYSISSCGKLKNNKTNRIIKTFLAGSGYEYCRIINSSGYSKTTIHSLVALCFIGKKPDGLEIDHIDRNKLNNSITNLRYVNKSINLLNRNVVLKSRKNKLDENFNIKSIKKDNIITGYSVVIKQKYYGYFTELRDAIDNRNLIISQLNI